jgi:hypothetical protein
MGREATVAARVGAETATVKALLESTELILRGAIRRRYTFAALQSTTVIDGELRFGCGDEAVSLALGDSESRRWLAKMNSPAPTLAAKLGIGPTAPAWVWGDMDDAALAVALHGRTSTDAAVARVMVAVVRSEAELVAAIDARLEHGFATAWFVHPKGHDASLGDGAIRQRLRALGAVDNKTSAVSAGLTATRYVWR